MLSPLFDFFLIVFVVGGTFWLGWAAHGLWNEAKAQGEYAAQSEEQPLLEFKGGLL